MNAVLWQFEEFLAAVRGRAINPPPEAMGGISIDSRAVALGDAFFAIKGERLDGHQYVGPALGAGAATCVVSQDKLPSLGRITGSMVVVADVLQALGDLGVAARARSHARIAAITGSVGKTTSKEMLLLALSRQGRLHGAVGSFNNHWGVPLTLARMPANTAFGIFEIGMNHEGEIAPLTKMVRPHVALVTNVEAVHLAHFPGLEAIADAKAEIFQGIEKGGVAVIPRDSRFYDQLRRRAEEAGVEKTIGFGTHDAAEARLDDFVLTEDSSMVAARILGIDVIYTISAPGRHLVNNSLAVLAAVGLLGGDIERAAQNLGAMIPPSGRGRRFELPIGGGAALLIDESYNANPASMRAAIALLGQAVPAKGGRRIAVLGDMLELGPLESELHVGLLEPLAAAGVDLVFGAGPRLAALFEVLPQAQRGIHTQSAAELLQALGEEIRPGDTIMVKGSNGMRMGALVGALLQQFRSDDPARQERS